MKDAVRRLVAAVVVFLSGAVFASPTWIGASGNWSDAANWQGGVRPTETDTVCISNTVPDITINLDAPSVTIKAIRFEGHGAKGVVTVTGGRLVLTSAEWYLAPTGGSNDFYWQLSRAAILAYPWGADFRVPVEFTTTGITGVIATGADLHFHKTVTAANATELRFHLGTVADSYKYVTATVNVDAYLHDSFRAPKANVTTYQSPSGRLHIYGPSFEANSLVSSDWVSSAIRLMSTNTVLHAGTISPMFGSMFQSEVAGSYPTNAVFHYRKNTSTKNNDFEASIDLGMVDRTIDRITSAALSPKEMGYTVRSYANNQGGVSYYGSAPTTLTLRGTKDAATEAKIMDEITVVWDPIGNFTQAFSNRTHTTKGSFVVKRGRMLLGGAGSMAAARSLEIAAGATFELDSSVSDPLPRDLIVTSSSKLKLNGATVRVKRLIVNGVLKPDGTYTGEPWLDSSSTVIVAAGNCRTWIGGSGNWADTAKWAGGQVPNASTQTAILDAETDSDITVTMNADIAAANFPGQLEVVNRGAGTTTLRVAANVTDTNGLVRVARHARVEVPEGGTFFYETTDGRAGYSVPWHRTHVLAIVDGGQWLTCGGEVVFTNLCGQCWVNGAGSKLVVSAGKHTYSGWSSAYPLSVGAGARLELTGGTLYLPHEGFNQDTDLRLFGGTADLSGGVFNANAECIGIGSAGRADWHAMGIDPGYGTFIQRGTVDVKFPSTIAFRSFFTGTHTDWIIRDNVRLYGNNYLIGGRRYGDTTLSISDQPVGDYPYYRDWVACGNFYVAGLWWNHTTGADAAAAQMLLRTGAALYAGFNGVMVAGGNASIIGVVPFYMTGSLRVEPKALLHVYGSFHEAYNAYAPTGIRVGVAACTGITSGRSCVGRAEIFGTVTNRLYLTIGGWYGKGTYVQQDGLTYTCQASGSLEHALTAVGFAGGEGALLVSNGVFTSQQSVWVGGCFTNDFVITGATSGQLYPNHYVDKGGWPIDDHGAEGLIEVVDGDFTAAKSLYVGSDGTGVVSVVGSKGSFTVGKDLVLSNKTASIARFTADTKGVAPIQVGGRLVLTEASALDVDLSACPNNHRMKLFTATDGIVGEFGATTIVPRNRQVIRRGNTVYAIDGRGLVLAIW